MAPVVHGATTSAELLEFEQPGTIRQRLEFPSGCSNPGEPLFIAVKFQLCALEELQAAKVTAGRGARSAGARMLGAFIHARTPDNKTDRDTASSAITDIPLDVACAAPAAARTAREVEGQ
jgi:hypothetical protein